MLRYVHKLYGHNLESLKLKSIPTKELLPKLGFVNHPSSGLVNWLPMGLSVLKKITGIIQKRMDQAGYEETALTTLTSADLWKKSGRWNNSEIFKLHDGADREYCLAPTAEEEITNIVAHNLSTYKSLPLLFYQISKKYRDELRPRGGLLRGKEFIMKDAYSFDLDQQNAMDTYTKTVNAYHQIFKDLRIPYVAAEADSGDMGGNLSHEWHYLHESGEDSVFVCDNCHQVTNSEKTISFPQESQDVQRVSVKYFTTVDRSTLVCAYFPSDRALQENLIELEIPDLDLKEQDQQRILEEFSDEDALINKSIVRIMDSRLTSRSNFPDFPINFVNRSLMTTLTDIPIVTAKDGEICGNCEDGTLSSNKAIEVGHTFYLGDRYTKPFECVVEVPDAQGNSCARALLMGCYGIGLSRIVAAAAELTRDEQGLRWPSAIAPWSVTIVEASSVLGSIDELYQKLNEANVDYRIDHRGVGLGKKIKHSHLMGIPLVIIVGKHYPLVEIEIRGKRYGEEWKQSQRHAEFEWLVQQESDNEKHLVHIDGVAKAVDSLLKDM